MSEPAQHPTRGLCKRCGEPLPRAWFASPIDGRMVADRWCSDHCYNTEAQDQSMRLVRAQRMQSSASRAATEDAA